VPAGTRDLVIQLGPWPDLAVRLLGGSPDPAQEEAEFTFADWSSSQQVTPAQGLHKLPLTGLYQDEFTVLVRLKDGRVGRSALLSRGQIGICEIKVESAGQAQFKVKDSSGEPMADAEVTMTPQTANSDRSMEYEPSNEAKSWITDPDGSALAKELTPGLWNWEIQPSQEGVKTALSQTGTVQITPGHTALVEVTLAKGASLHGKLLNSEGQQLAGTISVFGMAMDGSQDSQRTEVGADGLWSVGGLRAGEKTVILELLESESSPTISRQISLKNGEDKELDFGLADENRCAIQGRATGFSGPLFALVMSRSGVVEAQAQVGRDGKFSFKGLSAGVKTVKVFGDNSESRTSVQRELDLKPGQTAEVELVKPAGGVRAKVELPDGSPLVSGGVMITLLAPDTLSRIGDQRGFVATDLVRDGAFEIAGIAPGSYYLFVMDDEESDQLVKSIIVPADGALDLGTLRLNAGRTLEGRVLGDANQPVVAILDATRHDGSEVLVRAPFSDMAGRFQIPGLPTGKLRLFVFAQGYAPAMFEVEASPVDLQLSRGGQLSARVTPPSAGRELSLHREDGYQKLVQAAPLTLDDSGYAQFQNLAPGQYRLLLHPLPGQPGGEVRSEPINISEGQTSEATFRTPDP